MLFADTFEPHCDSAPLVPDSTQLHEDLESLRFLMSVVGLGAEWRWGRGRRLRSASLCLFSSVLFLVHVYIFSFMVRTFFDLLAMFGLWHVFSVASVISALKPLVNAVHFAIFLLGAKRHRRMLERFSQLNIVHLEGNLHQPPETRPYPFWRYKLCLVGYGLWVWLLNAAIIIGEICTKTKPVDVMTDGVSLLMLPMIGVWGALPLAYYLILIHFVTVHIRNLRLRITSLRRPGPFFLKQCFEEFMSVVRAQSAMMDFFGPWVFFSLAWSLASLCLTIYFTEQTDKVASLPSWLTEEMRPEELAETYTVVTFNLIWTGLHVFFGLLNILLIPYSGAKLNEKSRLVVHSVLGCGLKLERPTEEDDFYVSCLVSKLSSQAMWGISVWRAFPIERSVFFTILSAAVTYAMFLIRYAKNKNRAEPAASIENDSLTAF